MEILQEGWYLMSLQDLEAELLRHKDPGEPGGSTTERLTQERAMAIRERGNIPDAEGRSLRLVLHVDGEPLASKRLRFEPDLHEAPTWRREGSKPVHIVPLRPESGPEAEPSSEAAWWEQADVAGLESEWRERGRVGGLAIPGAYRSFLLKTIASMTSAGLEISIDSVIGSLSRWLQPDLVAEIRSALVEANAKEPPD